MIKKYRHIPTGAIVTKSPTGEDIYYNEFGGGIASYYLKGQDWEEIKEISKIYEIQSYRHINRAIAAIYTKENNKDFYSYGNKEYENMLEILSVKRLSDNQIFTIGDRLNINHGIHVIKEFKEVNNQIVIHFNKNNNTHSYHETECTCTQLLQNAHKPIVEALFNTSDNVPIYKNQLFYLIDIVDNYKIIEAKANYTIEYYKTVDKTKFKSFSTKGTAEEWVKKNKKVYLFTTQDGIKKYQGDIWWYVNSDKSIIPSQIIDTNGRQYNPDAIGKRFHTQQAAQKWIELQKEDRYYNTPCLSINDVAKVYVTANSKSGVYKQPQKLLNLVKEKLKNEGKINKNV